MNDDLVEQLAQALAVATADERRAAHLRAIELVMVDLAAAKVERSALDRLTDLHAAAALLPTGEDTAWLAESGIDPGAAL